MLGWMSAAGKLTLDCRRCVHWIDRPLSAIEADPKAPFLTCEIHGQVENFDALPECPDYRCSEELYTACSRCGQRVPKICVSLGECINCINTDLWCVEHCDGQGEKKFCTHRARLQLFGHSLIQDQQVFDLYPDADGDPARDPPPISRTGS